MNSRKIKEEVSLDFVMDMIKVVIKNTAKQNNVPDVWIADRVLEALLKKEMVNFEKVKDDCDNCDCFSVEEGCGCQGNCEGCGKNA